MCHHHNGFVGSARAAGAEAAHSGAASRRGQGEEHRVVRSTADAGRAGQEYGPAGGHLQGRPRPAIALLEAGREQLGDDSRGYDNASAPEHQQA